MTEGARGILLMSLVLSVTLGPAWTAQSSSTPDATSAANTSGDTRLPAPEEQPPPYEAYSPHEKRAQMGFHGMRGKKDFEPSDAYMPSMSEWSKRATMGFHGMRGKKWDDGDFDKRASMGFQGMRGKKWSDYEDAVKRASMGFQGMRGKKDDDSDLLDVDFFKRAQMGFHGMRGKKLYPDETYELIPLLDYSPPMGEVVKRAMSGFHGMRGKKDVEFLDLEKRAMGFQGMRGKKDDEFSELNKRGGNMGFHGMRGKKDQVEGGDSLVDSGFEKRAMGFHGMRGKKENEFSFKRAMGFLGMRGKKTNDDWALSEDSTTPNLSAGEFQ